MTNSSQELALAVLAQAKENGTLDPSIEKRLAELIGVETRTKLEKILGVKEEKPTPDKSRLPGVTEKHESVSGDLEALTKLWNEGGAEEFLIDQHNGGSNKLLPAFENKGFTRILLEDFKSMFCVRRELGDNKAEILVFPHPELPYRVMKEWFTPKDGGDKGADFERREIGKILRPARLASGADNLPFRYRFNSIPQYGNFEKGIGEYPAQ